MRTSTEPIHRGLRTSLQHKRGTVAPTGDLTYGRFWNSECTYFRSLRLNTTTCHMYMWLQLQLAAALRIFKSASGSRWTAARRFQK
jgi:hypothetical protein